MTASPPAQDSVPLLIQKAAELIGIRRFAQAITFLQQALVREPENPEALCNLALAFHLSGRQKDALRCADRAVAAGPQLEWGHRLRSVVLRAQRKRGPALKAAETAVSLAPFEPMCLYNLGAAELSCGLAWRAHDTGERLRGLAPGLAISYELLGEVHLKLGNYQAAEENCRKALAINPQSYAGLNNLGVAVQKQGRRAEAIDLFHRAAKVDPDHAAARSNLKRAVERYLRPGAVFLFVFYVFIQAVSRGNGTLSVPEGVVLTVLVVGGIVAYWLWNQRRRKSVAPEVMAYVEAEQKRSRNDLLLIAITTLVTVAAGFMLFASIAGTLADSKRYALSATDIIADIALSLILIGTWTFFIRRALRIRRQRRAARG